jgi:16S rRNA (cytosine1402-N4)-methyltransferase
VQAGHEPVLLAEVVGFFAPLVESLDEFTLVDCTLGLGGHAEALLDRFPEASLIGIDRDPEAIALAAVRLRRFGGRARLARGRFSELGSVLNGFGVSRARGFLADLGISSMQLEAAKRGFSFQLDGPLDMRMGGQADEGEDMTARDVLQTYSEKELQRLLRQYGEEINARQIARAIVDCRAERPLETTGELRRLIEKAKPAGGRRKKIHPATQTFQALRMEVNRELAELESLLDQSVRHLESDGRLVLISYHSGEDRIVKHTLRHLATAEVEPVTGRPRAETRMIELLTKRAVRPSEEEVARNPRSRSARLRAARRL